MPTVFEAVGGADGLLALAHAWHERCLADPVMEHPFSHPGQHPEHLERLAAYWGEALGGPARYTDAMGDETLVLRMHAGNGEHVEMDRRAVACFDAALTDVGITDDPLRALLHDYFQWSTDRMAENPETPDTVPEGVPLPKWSWDGLVVGIDG
ncbi:MAG: group II truncated hemoglobin [Acidimicrobiia bacterium]